MILGPFCKRSLWGWLLLVFCGHGVPSISSCRGGDGLSRGTGVTVGHSIQFDCLTSIMQKHCSPVSANSVMPCVQIVPWTTNQLAHPFENSVSYCARHLGHYIQIKRPRRHIAKVYTSVGTKKNLTVPKNVCSTRVAAVAAGTRMGWVRDLHSQPWTWTHEYSTPRPVSLQFNTLQNIGVKWKWWFLTIIWKKVFTQSNSNLVCTLIGWVFKIDSLLGHVLAL